MNAFEGYGNIVAAENLNNPWEGTPFEKMYLMKPASQGKLGEKIVKQFLADNGYTVSNRLNSGHDCIANGKKTEIKFGLATKRNLTYEFTFNHIGLKKDWEQIIFVGVNGDGTLVSVIYPKDNLPLHLFSRQQGGKKGQNDDYMITQECSRKLFFQEGFFPLDKE